MKAACLLALTVATASAALPDPDAVLAGMKRATAFCAAKLAVRGGYASAWKDDLSAGITEHHESPTLISIQPPGTTILGLVFVRAWQATGDAQFLEAAKAAGAALVACQLASGGWDSDHDFAQATRQHLHQQALAGDAKRGDRRAISTLDDNKTQSALRFLLELAHLPECRGDAVLQEALQFGLDCLLAAQFPNGAWPQQFDGPADPSAPVLPAAYPDMWPREWPRAKYADFYTLNDGNHQRCVELLLRAHELTGQARYLQAARKAGDFLLLAQLPEPQPVWAQQYNRAMEPVWARKFEPPSVTGGESLGALETLHELHVVTGDPKYLQPLPAALAWYERSRLADGRYARFYELRTNRPLYFVKDSYALTYDDANLPTHYGFKLDHIARDLEQLKERLQRPREELLAKRAGPSDAKSWASRAKGAAGKAQRALESQDARGVWTKDGVIDAGEMVKHLQAMTQYVEAARRGGEAFARLRRP